jgi:hypothetical protein
LGKIDTVPPTGQVRRHWATDRSRGKIPKPKACQKASRGERATEQETCAARMRQPAIGGITL